MDLDTLDTSLLADIEALVAAGHMTREEGDRLAAKIRGKTQ